jgi:hypothetical protein
MTYLLLVAGLDGCASNSGGEMPALGNKGKVFCSFVEYHWDSRDVQHSLHFKRAILNPSYIQVTKRLNVILASVEVGLSGGNRLAFSSKRPGRYWPAATRDKRVD